MEYREYSDEEFTCVDCGEKAKTQDDFETNYWEEKGDVVCGTCYEMRIKDRGAENNA